MKIHMEKHTVLIYLPGFKYDDFDRAGILTGCICFVLCVTATVRC